MSDKWFVKKQENVFGPVSADEIQNLIKNGRVTLDQEASQNEEGPWEPLKSYDLFKERPRPIEEMFEDEEESSSDGNVVIEKWFVKKEDGVVVLFSKDLEDRLMTMGVNIFMQTVIGRSETGPWKSISRRAKDRYKAIEALAKNQSRYRAWGIWLLSVIMSVVLFSVGSGLMARMPNRSPAQEMFHLLVCIALGYSLGFLCVYNGYYYFITKKLRNLPEETLREMWIDIEQI